MKKYKKYIIFTMLILVGGFLCIIGFTYAKYVSNTIWDFYLRSKGFYFSSDYLGSIVEKNADSKWNGESVHFTIKNTINQTLITDYDINYTVTCTINGDAASHAECHVNGTNSNTQNDVLAASHICINSTGDLVDVSEFNEESCTSGGYNWTNQVATKDLYFDIVLTDYNYELKDVFVNVTVNSTSPYRKVLSGDFALYKSDIKENTLTMNYKNYSNYDRLIISNSYLNGKCVKVTWDSDKLLISADNSEFSSYLTDEDGYINEIKFNIGAKNSTSYMFYKRDFDEIIIPDTDVSIEESVGCQ